MNTTLSLLVPYSGDRLEQFHRALHSIYYQQSDMRGVELLVLNDSQRTSPLSLLRRYTGKFPIRYFEMKNPTRKAYVNSASRRNFLVKNARGLYLLITDPEVVHLTQTINQIRTAFETHGDDVWYCGPVLATSSVVTPSGRLAYYDRQQERNMRLLWGPPPVKGKPLRTSWYMSNAEYTNINDPHFTEFFWCTAVAKSHVVAVEGCNESFKVYGYEEIELFRLLYKRGVRRLYDPAYITCHLPHRIALSPAEQRYWWIYNRYHQRLPQPSWGTLHGTETKEITV